MPTLTANQRTLINYIRDNNFLGARFLIEDEHVSIDFLADPNSNTDLLTYAVQIGANYTVPADHLKMITLLLTRNPPLDRFNKQGHTPLSTAAYNGYLAIAEALINAGATVNIMGIMDTPYLPRARASAFHHAALTGNIEMLRLLHSRGADINAVKIQVKREGLVTRDTFFPLFEKYNHTSRETALDITSRQGHTEASEFLRGLGAVSFQPREPAQATRQGSCIVL